MSLIAQFRSLLAGTLPSRVLETILTPRDASSSNDLDTLTHIAVRAGKILGSEGDLLRLYQALGNANRARGNLEGSVHTRKILLETVELAQAQRAEVLLELGRDYVGAGFLDRAAEAFEEAARNGAPSEEVDLEIARLAAQTNNFAKAAAAYSRLGNRAVQAHYLVRQGRETDSSQEDLEPRLRGIRQALAVYPGSVEAWLERLCILYDGKNARELAAEVPRAMYAVLPRLRFVLLEGLLQHAASDAVHHGTPLFDPECARALEKSLKGLAPDVLVAYYGGVIQLKAGMIDNGKTWLEKSLLLESNFWPARLELLKLNMINQTLTPEFQVQIEYFIRESVSVRRFVCRNCGLKREQIFFFCPKCRSWHSIAARKSLSE